MSKRKSKIRLFGTKKNARFAVFNLRTPIRNAEMYKTKKGWVVRTFIRKKKKK